MSLNICQIYDDVITLTANHLCCVLVYFCLKMSVLTSNMVIASMVLINITHMKNSFLRSSVIFEDSQ